MAKISFKNVGSTYDSKKFVREIKKADAVPYGIITPLALSTHEQGIFRMHLDLVDQIHDDLKNLILTNHGEKPNSYLFGANLRPLMFELTPGEFEEAAPIFIKNAVESFMPGIELSDLILDISTPTRADASGLAQIDMIITYNIPYLNVVDKPLRLIFKLGG